MDTKKQLTIMSEVCRQDLKIISNREKLNRLNLENKEATDAATKLEGAISELTNTKADLLKKRRTLDDKLQLEKANLRKWETRAEKIKGEREYTALMSEIGAQKRTITGIELQINEVSEELKSGEEKLKKAGGAHEEKTQSAERAYNSVKELLTDEQGQLQKNEAVREALLEKIPKVLRLKYERIYEKRSQQGIAFLKDSICQACMRMVPPELFIRVMKGEIIEQCPSCQRILVADMPQQNG
jgi:uncharacterized protein